MRCWSEDSTNVFSWLSVDSAVWPSLHLARPSTDLTSSIFSANGRLSMKIFVKNSGGSVSTGLDCLHYAPHRKKGTKRSCMCSAAWLSGYTPEQVEVFNILVRLVFQKLDDKLGSNHINI